MVEITYRNNFCMLFLKMNFGRELKLFVFKLRNESRHYNEECKAILPFIM